MGSKFRQILGFHTHTKLPLPPHFAIFGWKKEGGWSIKKLSQCSEILLGLLIQKILGLQSTKITGDPTFPPHYVLFGRTKGGNIKSGPRVPKL
jgi:hypothetical protein